MKPLTLQDEDDREPVNIWPLVARPHDAALPSDPNALCAAAGQFAELVSPVLANHLLAPVADRNGEPLLDKTMVKHSGLATAFSLAQQRRWAQALVETGIETVFLKGFANAHTLYPEAYLRIQGDLDILVRQADLQSTVAFLMEHGFRFRSSPVNPWGMISDASFMPLVSADGVCDIDIHVHPDCYPAHRSLTTELVFAAARTIHLEEFAVTVPCREHAFILCVTNTAKDKFDVFSIRKTVDAILLLRDPATLDWNTIIGLAKAGAFYRPLRFFLALLRELGVSMEGVPACLQTGPGGLGGGAFRRVVEDFRRLFPHEQPLTTLLWREFTICAEPAVALHNLGLRLRGLCRPMTGLPAGLSPPVKALHFSNSSNART